MRPMHRAMGALLLSTLVLIGAVGLLYAPPAAAACVDDAYEENDTAATAVALTAGTYPNLVVCPNDEDWFRVDLAAHTRIDASIAFRHAQGDLDLYLLDETGRRVLAAGTSQTDNETAVYTSTAPTTVYVRVVGYAGAGNTYTLRVALTATDDPWEENDTLAQAPLLAPGAYPGLILAAGDVDIFAVDVPANSILRATIFFTHAQGDLDLYLIDGTGTRTLRSSTSTTDNEQVIYPTTQAERVYLYIEGYRGASNRYDLVLEVEPAGACEEDSWTPNQSPESAPPLTPGAYGLTLCPDTTDWFALRPSTAGTVTVRLDFRHMLGDLDLRLWDANATRVLGQSLGSTDVEVVTLPLIGPRDVKVEVFTGMSLTLGVAYWLVRTRDERSTD